MIGARESTLRTGGRQEEKKRVVIFGPWPPPYGGVAIHVKNLARCLEERRIQVQALCYGDFSDNANLTRISLLREGWSHTLWRLYLSLSPHTILHDHSVLLTHPRGRYVRSFRWVIKLRKARWILTLHDETLLERLPTWPEDARTSYVKFLQWPEHIICVSERICSFLVQLGVSGERLTNISPLLPLSPIATSPLPDDVQNFLGTHTPVITAIGAFDPNYDFLTLANALPRILREHPNAGLILIDAGFTLDVPYREAVLQALENASGRACILLSKIPHDQVFHILRKSAVFVRGVRRESFGLSRVEAILIGTPVVATYAGETRYMMLYEYGDSVDLAEKVLMVLAKKPDLSEAQAFFRKMSEETLDRILDVYERTRH